MASELTYSINVKFSPSAAASDTIAPPRRTYSTSVTPNPVAGGQIQTIGTSEETITAVADITNFGLGFFQNLDSTNYVRIGKTGDMFCRIPPGECQLIWLEPGMTIYAQANTAPVKLKFWICDR